MEAFQIHLLAEYIDSVINSFKKKLSLFIQTRRQGMTFKMFQSKYTLYVLAFAYILFCAIQGAVYGGDFDVYLDAGQKIQNGQNIYQPPFYKGLQYYYGPVFALILAPFSALPFYVPEFFWVLFVCFCVYRIFTICFTYFPELKSQKDKFIWLAFSFICMYRFIIDDVNMIQVTSFLLWATLEAFDLFEKKKFGLGGALLALAITIKLLPLLFLPYLLYRGNWKALISTLFFIAVFLIAPGLFIGNDFNKFLLNEWWNIINPSNKEHVLEGKLGVQSLSALIPVYLTEVKGEIAVKQNIVSLNINTVNFILNLVRIIFILITLLFLRSKPFTAAKSKLNFFWEISYIFLVTPLLFPHQQKYAFLYLIPITMYLCYYFLLLWKTNNIRNHKTLTVFVTLTVFILSPIIGRDIIGSFIFDLIQHFRILTLVVIGIVPISLYCTPTKLLMLKEIYDK